MRRTSTGLPSQKGPVALEVGVADRPDDLVADEPSHPAGGVVHVHAAVDHVDRRRRRHARPGRGQRPLELVEVEPVAEHGGDRPSDGEPTHPVVAGVGHHDLAGGAVDGEVGRRGERRLEGGASVAEGPVRVAGSGHQHGDAAEQATHPPVVAVEQQHPTPVEDLDVVEVDLVQHRSAPAGAACGRVAEGGDRTVPEPAHQRALGEVDAAPGTDRDLRRGAATDDQGPGAVARHVLDPDPGRQVHAPSGCSGQVGDGGAPRGRADGRRRAPGRRRRRPAPPPPG